MPKRYTVNKIMLNTSTQAIVGGHYQPEVDQKATAIYA
jgi:hypothetical protein